MNVPKRWANTAPLPGIEDTADLPYVPAICRPQSPRPDVVRAEGWMLLAVVVMVYTAAAMVAGVALAAYWGLT